MYHTYMRIWLLTENWSPNIGGIQRYLTGIVEHLEDHEVTVIAPVGSTPSTNVLPKRFFWPMWPKWLPLYFALKKQARKEKPDIILCGKALVEGRIAKRLKRSLGIPFVVCTYGMEIATWSTHAKVRAQLKRTLQAADAVLYINQKTKQELIRLGAAPEKLHVVYPGVDEKKLSAMNNPETVLAHYNIQPPYILSVSRLVKRKGTSDLLEAFARQEDKNVQLVIVGDGPERKRLKKQAEKMGITVIFLGSIPDEELHALYSRATMFALTPKELPGDYEGFGIVYLEAGFFEIPVIGTKTGGVAEAVTDGVTGLLADPGNVDSIARALQKLCSAPTLATQLGKAGAERVTTKFLWKHTMENLQAIFEKIRV
jgi:phosphatidyl-myo-inositol dimannoside synthase